MTWFTAVFGNLVVAGWFGPSNFDECMVEQAKELEKGSAYIERVCQRKFEFDIPSYEANAKNIPIAWELVDDKKLSFIITSNPTDYEITKIKFAFSKKDCDSSKQLDFNIIEIVHFNPSALMGDKNTTTIELDDAAIIKCRKTLQYYGRLKN